MRFQPLFVLTTIHLFTPAATHGSRADFLIYIPIIPIGDDRTSTGRLIFRVREGRLNAPLFLTLQLYRSESIGQLSDLAGKAERDLIVLVVHRRAGIHADIEGLIDCHDERDRVWDLPVGDLFVVHLQHTCTAFAEAGPVISEVEHDGMLARRQGLLPLPTESLEIEEVVSENRLAFEHVQAI